MPTCTCFEKNSSYQLVHQFHCFFITPLDLGSDNETSAAALEEQEARSLQQQLAQQLDEADFDLDMFTVSIINTKYELPRGIIVLEVLEENTKCQNNLPNFVTDIHVLSLTLLSCYNMPCQCAKF